MKKIYNNFKNRKLRYILLIAFIVMMNVSLFVCLKIENYNLEIVNQINTKFGSYVTIEIDPKFLSDDVEIEGLSYEDYQKIGASKYVQETFYEQTLHFNLENTNVQSSDVWLGNDVGLYDHLTLVGSNNLDNDFDFLFNNVNLSKGSMPQNDFEVLVSTSFADTNKLNLNQYISILYNDTVLRFKIVGFYNSDSEIKLNNDTVYTTYNTTQIISQSDENVQAFYHLYSYKDVDNFETQLYNNGLSELFYVNNNKIIIEQETVPYNRNINSANSFKNTLTILFVVLIMIMSTLIFNSKKDAITIFRMLGVSKLRLILLTLLELSSIIFTALILSGLCLLIIDNTLLREITIGSVTYIYILRDMFIINLVILVLINLETFLFINGYNVNEIVTEKI